MQRPPVSGSGAPHPFVFLVLILPFGISAGFVTVTLAYQLTRAGVDAALVAGVIAADLLPQTWKFLWAPLADTTFTRKAWYRLGAIATAAGLLACGLIPPGRSSLPLLSALVLLMSFASSFVAMSVEGLIAHHTPDHLKGRASGWFQAGNLGGAGLGGGAGLWMAQHLAAPWMSVAVLGAVCAGCTLALVALREPDRPPSSNTFGSDPHRVRAALSIPWLRLGTVLRDLWALARSRGGFLALLIVFLPITTGAASNLWAAVADGWQASANTVALINGTLGGAVNAIGSLVGGFFCDRLNRKGAYLLYGVGQALCAVAMALAPRSEAMFVVFTMIYAVLNGMGYAAFSAVALESVGLNAAATQYNAFASLSNTPILYMGLIEGWAYARYGASAMLYSEAALAAVAMVVFAAAAMATRRKANC